jgi:hypothetical protein
VIKYRAFQARAPAVKSTKTGTSQNNLKTDTKPIPYQSLPCSLGLITENRQICDALVLVENMKQGYFHV